VNLNVQVREPAAIARIDALLEQNPAEGDLAGKFVANPVVALV
jgi:hypothetical protein